MKVDIALPVNTNASIHQPLRPLIQDDPESKGNGILALSASSLGTFTECAKKASYLLVERRVPVTTGAALDAGKAIHRYLESRFNGSSVEVAQQILRDSFPIVGDSEWRTLNHAAGLLTAYEKHYPTESFSLIEVDGKKTEIPFALELGEIEVNGSFYDPRTGDEKFYSIIKVIFNGVIDAIVEDYGEIFPMDHKTTSMLGATYFDQFRLSSQTLGYVYATQALLERSIAGAYINTLCWRKPSKTGIPYEFDRKKFRYSDPQVKEWASNTLTLAGDFLSHLSRRVFPMEQNWCVSKYGRCPYFDVCCLDPDDRLKLLHSPLFQDNVRKLESTPNEENT